MKVRVLAALSVTTLAVGACGPTKHGTASGAGGNPCLPAVDQAACLSCNEALYPAGATLLNELIDCLFCSACYTVCESSTQTVCGDAGAPAKLDACDKGVPSLPGAGTACGNQSGGCVQCAQQAGATCYAKRQACDQSAACLAFNAAILKCPAK